MTTLAEIEAAVEQLPAEEQKALLQFIADRIYRTRVVSDDPVMAIIGAFPSGEPDNNTARHDEDILYGHGEAGR